MKIPDDERFELLLRCTTDGIFTLDEELRIMDFNPAAEEITGWRAEEVLRRVCYEIFQGCDERGNIICNKERCTLLRKSDSEEGPREYEMSVRLKDGVVKHLRFQPLVIEGKSKLITMMLFRDISKMREFEMLRQDFMDSMSHELRTPITTIKAYIATMRHPKANFDKETLDGFLQIINQESDRLSKIIDNILEAAKISAKRLELELRPLELRPLFHEAVRTVKESSDIHAFEMEITSNPWVIADIKQMRYVLNHLLHNAIRFSPEGGRISIFLEEDHKDVVAVSVQDEGIGIPFNQQKKIFETFHRIDVGTTKKIYSVGMGLFIVKKIVEAHGGIIWVESSPGKGSKFTFTLPRAHEEPLA
jgi:PAS domain S-box-containing protein